MLWPDSPKLAFVLVHKKTRPDVTQTPSGRVAIRCPGEPAVTSFQESHWQSPRPLSPEQVTYLRGVLTTHANNPSTGKCVVCHAITCPAWCGAYDQLAAAGEVMAEPERVTHQGDVRSPPA